MGAQWLSGRVPDSRPKGRGFKPHRHHCVVSLSKKINPSLVLVQHRKTRHFLTEILLMGRKESNQKNKTIEIRLEEPYHRLHCVVLCAIDQDTLIIALYWPCADPEGGGGPDPPGKSQIYRVLAILVRIPWKITWLPSQHFMAGDDRPASKTLLFLDPRMLYRVGNHFQNPSFVEGLILLKKNQIPIQDH